MADIEVVIKIPEEDYERLKEYEKAPFNSLTSRVYEAIANGTLLPKGHNRLVYAEDVKQNHEKWIGYLDEDMIARLNIAIDKHVPTIIEADKENDAYEISN